MPSVCNIVYAKPNSPAVSPVPPAEMPAPGAPPHSRSAHVLDWRRVTGDLLNSTDHKVGYLWYFS